MSHGDQGNTNVLVAGKSMPSPNLVCGYYAHFVLLATSHKKSNDCILSNMPSSVRKQKPSWRCWSKCILSSFIAQQLVWTYHFHNRPDKTRNRHSRLCVRYDTLARCHFYITLEHSPTSATPTHPSQPFIAPQTWS
jgi:hypothetical protein